MRACCGTLVFSNTTQSAHVSPEALGAPRLVGPGRRDEVAVAGERAVDGERVARLARGLDEHGD